MKKLLIGICLFCWFSSGTSLVYAKSRSVRRVPRRGWFTKIVGGVSKSDEFILNRLTRVESAAGRYVSQVAFEFKKPIYYETNETKRGEQVKLYFPGMRLSDFDFNNALKKIKKLRVVQSVSIKHEKVPVSRVVLTMNFVKDSTILRLTKMEEPNLLVLDLFDKSILKKLREKVTTVLRASNDRGKAVNKRLFCLNSDSVVRGKFFQKKKSLLVEGGGLFLPKNVTL